MPAHDPRTFYDELADDYHLVYPDWSASIARQGAASDRVILDELGSGARSVLDCSCGIGTQAVGLAAHGHRVNCYDFDHVQLLQDGDTRQLRTRSATSRALTRNRLAQLAHEMGFSCPSWHDPESTGCFQPLLSPC